jgi:hypothetical protein
MHTSPFNDHKSCQIAAFYMALSHHLKNDRLISGILIHKAYMKKLRE